MADNTLLLEFAAKIDSSVRKATEEVARAIKTLNFNTAKLSDGIQQLTNNNTKAAAATRSAAAATAQATSAVAGQTAATQRAVNVSDQYIKQQEKLVKAHKAGTAARGDSLRALQKTEDAWQRETKAVRTQEGALRTLQARMKGLQETQSQQTTQKGLDQYTRKIAAVERGMGNLRTSLVSANKDLEKSFNYGNRFAKELEKVQQQGNKLSPIMRKFANELPPIQQLAARIASTMVTGSVAQKVAVQDLTKFTVAYGKALDDINARISASKRAMAGTAGAARTEIQGTIAGLQDQKKALTGMLADPIRSFSEFQRGASELSKGVVTAMLRGADFTKMMDTVKDRLKSGAIDAKTYKEQATGIVKADRAMQALGAQYKMTREQVGGLTRAYGAENLVAAARNGILTQTIRQMKEQEGLARKTRGNFSFAGDIAASMKSLATYAVSGGILYGIFGAFSSGAKAVKEYSQALKDLKAITQASDRDVAMLGTTILEITAKYKYSLTEVVSAATIIGQAGFSATDTMRVLSSAMTLAQGTMSDIKQTTDLITTSLTAFQSEGLGAAAAADMLAQAVNKSKLDIEKLRTIFNYIGPVATDAGISFQETSAALMVLANQGMRASTIGTSLRNIFSRLQSPNKALRAAFKGNGEELAKLSDKSVSLTEKFTILGRVLGDTADLYSIFGLRAAGAVSILMRFPDQVEEMRKSMYRMGLAEEMAATQMEGLSNKILNLKAKLQTLAVAAGDDAGKGFGILISMLSAATDAIIIFTSSAEGRALTSMVAFAAGIAGVVTVGAVLVKLIGMLMAPLATMVAGFAASQLALLGASSAMGTASVAARGLAASLTFIAAHPVGAFFVALLGTVALVGQAYRATADATAKAREEQDKYIQGKQEEIALLNTASVANKELGDDEVTRLMNRNYLMEKLKFTGDLGTATTEQEIQRAIDALRYDTEKELVDAIVARIKNEQERLKELTAKLAIQQAEYIASAKGGPVAAPRQAQIWRGASMGMSPNDLLSVSDSGVGELTATTKKIQEAREKIRADILTFSKPLQIEANKGELSLAAYTLEMTSFAASLQLTDAAQSTYVDGIVKTLVAEEKHRDSMRKGKVDTDIIKESFIEAGAAAEHFNGIFDKLPARLQAAYTQMAYNLKTKLSKMKFAPGEAELVKTEEYKKLYADFVRMAEEDSKIQLAIATRTRDQKIELAAEESKTKEEYNKAVAAANVTYAEKAKELTFDMHVATLSALLQLDDQFKDMEKEDVEKKIKLILSSNYDELPQVLKDLITNNANLFNTAFTAIGATENKAGKATAKDRFGGGGGRGFAREERRRLDAMKAELDAEQARNELKYEKGQYGEGLEAYRAYTMEKLEIERQMLGARKALVASMVGKAGNAEDRAAAEKEFQQLAKEEAEFELKYLKEVRAAEFKLIDEKATALQNASDRELILIDRNSTHYITMAEKELDATIRNNQARVDGLKEKLTYEINAVEKTQLQNDLHKAQNDLLQSEIDKREKLNDLMNKYIEQEYKMGQRSGNDYAEEMRRRGLTGEMDPYKAEQEALLATGSILDMLAVGFERVKEKADTFGETVANLADTIHEGIMSSVDIMVDSWHDGTKSMAEAFGDLATSVVKDMQKMVMKNFITGILYGGQSPEGGGGLMGGGGLIGGILGMFTGGCSGAGQKGQDNTNAIAQQQADRTDETFNQMLDATLNGQGAMANATINGSNAQIGIAAGEASATTSIFSSMGQGVLGVIGSIGNGIFNILGSLTGGGGGGGGLGGILSSVVGGVMGMFMGGGGGGGAASSGIGGGMYNGNPSGSWLSGVSYLKKHSGGFVSRGHTMAGVAPAEIFASAPRYHNGGKVLKPGEVAAVLKEGEYVQTAEERRNMGKANVSVPVTLNVNNNAKNTQAEASATKDAGGGLTIEVMVKEMDKMMAGMVPTGESKFANAMDKSRGLNRATALYDK